MGALRAMSSWEWFLPVYPLLVPPLGWFTLFRVWEMRTKPAEVGCFADVPNLIRGIRSQDQLEFSKRVVRLPSPVVQGKPV